MEAHVGGLRALGVPTESYGSLLTSVLVHRVPPEIKLIVSREMTGEDHLLGLELADSADVSDVLEFDMLIGSDTYWDLVTGKIIRGRSGPTAIHTKVGWVLSGPADRQGTCYGEPHIHLDTTSRLMLTLQR